MLLIKLLLPVARRYTSYEDEKCMQMKNLMCISHIESDFFNFLLVVIKFKVEKYLFSRMVYNHRDSEFTLDSKYL